MFVYLGVCWIFLFRYFKGILNSRFIIFYNCCFFAFVVSIRRENGYMMRKCADEDILEIFVGVRGKFIWRELWRRGL